MNLGKETETVEFKKTTGEIEEAVIDISAILNKKSRGILYFGVRPDGEIIGQQIGEHTLDDIARHCKDSISPMIYPSIEISNMGGHEVIVVKFEGRERPYSCNGRYYKRVSDRSELMTTGELRSMLLDTDYSSQWENRGTNYGLESVDKETLRRFYHRATESGRLEPLAEYDDEVLLSSMGLLEEGKLTNAGSLLFSNKKPLALKAAVYLTDERLNFSDLRRFEGNIFQLIDMGYQYISDHINWKVEVRDGSTSRTEVPEIPVRAIREAIVNAFAHADYRGMTEHEIDITPTMVEIYNPGSFPEGLTPESFENGRKKSYPRNKVLLSALFKSKDVEMFGSGIRKIFSLCRQSGNEVKYDLQDDGVSVIFMRKKNDNLQDSQNSIVAREKNILLTSTDQKVLQLLSKNSVLTRSEIATELGLAVRTIQRSEEKLVLAGKIRRIGSKRYGYWEIL